jgi:hypothetical protein
MPPASHQLDLTPEQDRLVRMLALVLFLAAGVLMLAGAAWVALGVYNLIKTGIGFASVWIALLTLGEGGLGLLLGNILMTTSNDFGYVSSARAYGARHLTNALTGLQHFAFGVIGLAALVVLRILSLPLLGS